MHITVFLGYLAIGCFGYFIIFELLIRFEVITISSASVFNTISDTAGIVFGLSMTILFYCAVLQSYRDRSWMNLFLRWFAWPIIPFEAIKGNYVNESEKDN